MKRRRRGDKRKEGGRDKEDIEKERRGLGYLRW
jgi:hypothetical protein